jgi:PAS domain S-box-containing protein
MRTSRFAAVSRRLIQHHSTFLVGVCGGVLYWLIDVLVDVYFFEDGTFARQLFHPGPQEVWVRAFALCMMVGGGFIVAGTLTKKKQTEEELKIARMRIRDDKAWSESILDAVADGISIQGPDYRVLYQNRTHRAFLGDHLGKFCYAAYEQRPSLCGNCPVTRTFADGGIHTEERSAEIGAELRHFEITASPLFDASGSIIAGIETVREITGRVRADRSLRDSEQRFRMLFEESKDVFYISTMDGRFIEINPAGVELFGYASKEELLAVNIGRDIYVNPEDRKRFVELVNETSYAREYEVLMKRKDGEKLWVLITSTALHDSQGSVTGFRGIIRDVTEHKKLEQQLLQSQKMEAIGLLAGGIAHDFNNILTAVIGYGNLLKKNLQDNDRLRGYADQVLESGHRASRLTKSILAFSRKQVLKPEPVDLNPVIARVEKFLARLIGEDIILKAVLQGADMTVMADSTQIEQVLINLATNARDSMPKGGSLLIETSVEKLDEEHANVYGLGGPGKYAAVRVQDTGSGFDEKTRARIFEPFFTTKETGKGTGLGLSIVHGIISQHGGQIMVDSVPGVGTTFKFYLPLVQQQLQEAPPAIVGAAPAGGREAILLAEDDETVRGLVRGILENAGYTIFEASDGEDALRIYFENPDRIRLLILDVVMPRKNGKEVYEEIRSAMPDIRPLFISGYTSDIIHKKGVFDATLDFILKPFSGDELLRKVREVLDRTS